MSSFVLLKEVLEKNILKETWKITLVSEWQTIVGPLATRMKLEKIEGSTLVVGVYNASWLHELSLLSTALLNMINDHFDKPYIHKIIFKTASRKKPLAVAATTNAVPPVKSLKPIELSYAQKTVLARIEDLELRRLLRDFLSVCKGNESL